MRQKQINKPKLSWFDPNQTKLPNEERFFEEREGWDEADVKDEDSDRSSSNRRK
jgi:hypothetical protein